MAFSESDLLLSADRSAQLTKALADPLGVADPLQYLCDEASADVARLTAGYVIDANALRGFIRALALYRIYGYAGPVPKDVQVSYDAAQKELEAIASGKRPNLPRTDAGVNSPSGASGTKPYVPGRMETTGS